MPFFEIVGADLFTCIEYNKGNETEKKKVGVYVMQFAEEDKINDEGYQPQKLIKPLDCRVNIRGEIVFEIPDDDVDLYMDVVNPLYLDSQKIYKSKQL